MLELIGRALAQTGNTSVQSGDIPRLSIFTGGSLPEVVAGLISVILIVAGVIAVIFLIYGGILYITAGGNPEAATKGRTAIINAVIGIIIIALAILIVRWVGGIAQQNGQNLGG